MYGRRLRTLLLMSRRAKGVSAGRIALGGVIAALMAVVMLTSYFPYLTYAIPAIAGLLVIVPMVEFGAGWAVMTYIAASAVVMLTAENEAKTLFVVFFGFYPVVKAMCERMRSRFCEYAVKFAVFNAAVAVYAAVSIFVLSIPVSEFTQSYFGVFTVPILIIGANAVFYVYDMGATRVITMYIMRLHPKVKKLLK